LAGRKNGFVNFLKVSTTAAALPGLDSLSYIIRYSYFKTNCRNETTTMAFAIVNFYMIM